MKPSKVLDAPTAPPKKPVRYTQEERSKRARLREDRAAAKKGWGVRKRMLDDGVGTARKEAAAAQKEAAAAVKQRDKEAKAAARSVASFNRALEWIEAVAKKRQEE